MSPLDIMEAASAGAPEARMRAWRWVGRAMCAGMGWWEAAKAAADAMALGWKFARVVQSPANPRCFVLADAADQAGRGCLLIALDVDGAFWPPHRLHPAVALAYPPPADILALDLKAGSNWFRRATATTAVMPGSGMSGDVLPLWQNAKVFVGVAGRAALAAQRVLAGGRAPLHPAAWPEGWLVLDPAALPWKGAALKGVEAIELVDAPADGPLGRVLKKMNRRIGGRGAHAIALRGSSNGVRA